MVPCGNFVEATFSTKEVVNFDLGRRESDSIVHCMCIPCIASDEVVAVIKVTGADLDDGKL